MSKFVKRMRHENDAVAAFYRKHARPFSVARGFVVRHPSGLAPLRPTGPWPRWMMDREAGKSSPQPPFPLPEFSRPQTTPVALLFDSRGACR